MQDPLVELPQHEASSFGLEKTCKQESLAKGGMGGSLNMPERAGIPSKLFGILPRDADLASSREERLSRVYDFV